MAALPPLSLSILGVEPLDEFILVVADFIHAMIRERPEHLQNGKIEVEAKIGVLREKNGSQRIALPVICETILAPNAGIDMRFESNMSKNQHQHFNNLLNNLMEASNRPGHPSSPLEYTHLYLVDSFHEERGDKIRVTTDEKTGKVVECLRKKRLGNIDIYSPVRAADWRVSVNVEMPAPVPNGPPTHTRRKDRLSYAHEAFSIDLTQVKSQISPNAPVEVLHELEVEISRPDLLLTTAMDRDNPEVSEHERTAFNELIRAFVNNARILTKNSLKDGWS